MSTKRRKPAAGRLRPSRLLADRNREPSPAEQIAAAADRHSGPMAIAPAPVPEGANPYEDFATPEDLADARAGLEAEEQQERREATFTPAPGPQPALGRPYTEPAESAEPEPGEPETAEPPAPPRPFIFEQVAREIPGFGILPCTGCGAEYADADAAAYDRMLGRMRRTAHEAGWNVDGYGHWCCPACLTRDLPVLAGGIAADVELAIAARTVSGKYEDLGADREDFDRVEDRRRARRDKARSMRLAAVAVASATTPRHAAAERRAS
jgi:hypothetical protein